MVGVAKPSVNFVGDGVALGRTPGGDGMGSEGDWFDGTGYHYVVYAFPFVIVKVAAFGRSVISVIGKP